MERLKTKNEKKKKLLAKSKQITYALYRNQAHIASPPLNEFSAARRMQYMHCREYCQTAGVSGLPISALD